MNKELEKMIDILPEEFQKMLVNNINFINNTLIEKINNDLNILSGRYHKAIYNNGCIYYYYNNINNGDNYVICMNGSELISYNISAGNQHFTYSRT